MNRFALPWRRLAWAVGIGTLFLLVIEFNARLEELERLSKEAQAHRATATHLMHTQIALQTAVAYATSEAAVEGFARVHNRMAREGEIAVVPVGIEGEAILPATPTPTPAPTLLPNWQVWWDLFFGERP